MVTNINQVSRRMNIVGTYKIDTSNNVSFTVVFKENSEGLREFEILLSGNGSDDYSEVFAHPFYNNFVIPWTYNKVELEPTKNSSAVNVVNMSKYRTKND